MAAMFIAAPAHAALINRGNGLVYDSDLNITWLQNANLAATKTFGVSGILSSGQMGWSTAQAWIAAMNAAHYLGYSNWRLPQARPVNGSYYNYSFSYNGSTDEAYNVCAANSAYPYSTASELAHLFYDELGNKGFYNVSGTAQGGYGTTNAGPFINLSNLPWPGAPTAYVIFWSTPQVDIGDAMSFRFDDGMQYVYDTAHAFYVWPVLPGDPANPDSSPPVLSVGASKLAFYTIAGTNPADQTLTISNTGGGTLSWTASADNSLPAWLSISQASGTGSANLTVSANAAGLSPGTYTKAITITAQGASNSPQTVYATLTVNSIGNVVFSTNSGGGQYESQAGVIFQADTDYSGGTAASIAANITGTDDPTLYQTERYGSFTYNVPLANGNYDVTLKFAEIYWDAPGKRVFNVSIQGTQVITNLDIYAMAGKDAAYDLTFPATVTNGMLTINFTSVVDNAKVSAIEIASALSPNTYTITASTGTGGSISPPGATVVNSGNSLTYTITPSQGYSISAVTVDGAPEGALSSYTFSNVTGNHTISASFNPTVPAYGISASAGTGGSISPSGTVTVSSGSAQTFTITALAGYAISTVLVDGTPVGAVGSYTFSNITANHTISASFTAVGTSFAVNSGGGQYTSQSGTVYQADTDYSGGTAASTTANITGTNDPTLYQTERYGKTFAYNIPLANGNYDVTLKFAEIYWNAPGQRVFNVSMQGTQVISNLDIYAQAGKNTAYDVTVPASVTNGTLNISFTTVVDNAKISAIEIAPATVSTTYTITASAGTGGGISPSGTVNVASGGNQTFTITPAAGYAISAVLVDGTPIGAAGSYTFSNVTASHTISASFAAVGTSFAANSGGGQYTSQSGVVYQADTDFSGGATASTTATTTGTSDPTLYQTERYGKTFAYNIPLANGNYTVALKFAEVYWNAPGQRVFNVSIQGAQVLTNFDIYRLSGKDAAIDMSFPAIVTNGMLNIGFTTVVDNAKISAIEITPATVNLYAITASAGTGGSISPSGTVAVPSGSAQTFGITAAPGYSISDVLVDGASVGASGSSFSYAFNNVTANHTISASFKLTATSFAVNSGGGYYESPSGVVYQADTDFSGGAAASTAATIAGTSDPTLYQTERYGKSFSYNVPLVNGNYNVTLKFAEIYWNAPGERVFNVSLQGTQVLTNLDIYDLVGKNAAYDVTFPASVTNGNLNIGFTTVVDNAKISAIEVTPQ